MAGKIVVVYIIALIAMILAVYGFTGFRFLGMHTTTTTVIHTTSVTTTAESTTANYTTPIVPCNGFSLSGPLINDTFTARCDWTGGMLGLWVAAGVSKTERVMIVGANGRTYVNQTSSYNCTTFFQNFTGPSQVYTITFITGKGGGTCGTPLMKLNTTTSPPLEVYDYVYNSKFGNGEYTGWSVSGPGFGKAPLNITYANSKLCYSGDRWSNYNGTYFATTYNCGTAVAPGNLTSSPFLVSPKEPFLNFRLISPQNNNLYIELLRANYRISNGSDSYVNSTPVEIAYFNTYNLTTNPNSTSNFQNVTIALTQYVNQALQIRLVSNLTSTGSSDYVAAGDFVLSDRPNQARGVISNITSVG